MTSKKQPQSDPGNASAKPTQQEDEEGLQAEQESAVAMDSDVPQPSDLDEEENGDHV